MTDKRYRSFTDCYIDLIKETYGNPEYECAPRGLKIKEVLAKRFVISNPRDRLLYLPDRDFSLGYFMGETLWYMIGDEQTDWISWYSGFWKNISDDGKTANSAYGARLFYPHQRIAAMKLNQWEYIVNELKRDRDSRRAVMHIRVPEDSVYAKKDVPCTLTLQFFIRDDALHMVVNMRSSDLIFGISYDVPFFTLLQEVLAEKLEIDVGDYIHMSNSLHIYDRHFDMCEKIIADPKKGDLPAMPEYPRGGVKWSYLNAKQRDARAARSEQGVRRVAIDVDDKSFTEYERDMGLILVAHAAKKKGYTDLQKEILNDLSFEGYKFFDR